MDLRYGENPHQHGAFYRDLWPAPGTLATFTQLQGKELSYNNLADADAAWECVRQFERPGLRDRQARQPLRRGRGRGLRRCLRTGLRHRSRPPPSAASSPSTRTLDAATAKAILDRQFVEVLIAPDYEEGALDYATQEGQRARAAHPAWRRPQQARRRQARRLGPADADRRHPRSRRATSSRWSRKIAPTKQQMRRPAVRLAAWRSSSSPTPSSMRRTTARSAWAPAR